jgi:magnesium transporter
MISAIGGNVGSQTAAIIVRELSLNEINVKDFLIVLYKEFKISLLMAISLSFLAFCEVTIISFFKNTHCNYFLPLGVSLALFLQIIFSVLLGTILPITVKSLKGDPAVVASPAIATIVDVTGIVIYFLIFLHLKNFIFI